MRLSLRSLTSSLYARMALILLAGLLAAQGVSVWLQWRERSAVVTQARGLNVLDRIAEAVRMLEANDPERRAATLKALAQGGLRVELISAEQASAGMPRPSLQTLLGERLGSVRDIRTMGGGGPGAGMGMGKSAGSRYGSAGRSFDVRLEDGQWIRVTPEHEAEAAAPALPKELIIQLAISLGLVIAVVMIAVRQATLPLQQLASAAERLGRDLDAPPLAEHGPAETRRAAQAFNRMQTQVKRLVSERARALAAVSHDLRTPLTRLRLRVELVEDVPLREQLAGDMEAMATMIDATLGYLRGVQQNELVRPIDINALLESMVEDALVTGRTISIEGRALAPFSGRLSALRRALQNLIDNAIKYGRSAHIHVQDDAYLMRITVEDEGPGIAEAELVHVTEPYYRLDSARSQERGGVGLGLSIVKDIALQHGGEIVLANRPQGGLAATLSLPRT